MKKYIAITKDGINIKKKLEINKINIWIDRTLKHDPSDEIISALIDASNKSGKMTITEDGGIDAFNETPLYTNGQRTVIAIKDNNGELIWEK
jgi:hypothetical protein